MIVHYTFQVSKVRSNVCGQLYFKKNVYNVIQIKFCDFYDFIFFSYYNLFSWQFSQLYSCSKY